MCNPKIRYRVKGWSAPGQQTVLTALAFTMLLTVFSIFQDPLIRHWFLRTAKCFFVPICDNVSWYEEESSAMLALRDIKIVFANKFNSFPTAEFVTRFHNIPYILNIDKCIQSFAGET